MSTTEFNYLCEDMLDLNDVYRHFCSRMQPNIFGGRISFMRLNESGTSTNADTHSVSASITIIRNILNRLREGIFLDGFFICLNQLRSGMNDYPEWFLPSGRIRYRETEIQCAMRNMTESGLDFQNIAELQELISENRFLCDSVKLGDDCDIFGNELTQHIIEKKYYVVEIPCDFVKLRRYNDETMCGLTFSRCYLEGMQWASIEELMVIAADGPLDLFTKIDHALDATTAQSSPPADTGTGPGPDI